MRMLLLLTGLLSASVLHALETLAIKEPLIDIKPYLQAAQKTSQEPTLEAQEYRFNTWALPVKSRLRPGLISKSYPASTCAYHFFIIGDDALSKSWLEQNSAKLKTQHALGFVVNVDNEEAFEALQSLTDIPLMAMNVDDIASHFRLEHYPVACSAEELWQ